MRIRMRLRGISEWRPLIYRMTEFQVGTYGAELSQKARLYADRALKINERSVEALLQMARAYHTERENREEHFGDYNHTNKDNQHKFTFCKEQAEVYAPKALQIDSSCADAYVLLGQSAYQTLSWVKSGKQYYKTAEKYFKQAKSYYNKAVDVSRTAQERARAFYRLGELSERWIWWSNNFTWKNKGQSPYAKDATFYYLQACKEDPTMVDRPNAYGSYTRVYDCLIENAKSSTEAEEIRRMFYDGNYYGYGKGSELLKKNKKEAAELYKYLLQGGE